MMDMGTGCLYWHQATRMVTGGGPGDGVYLPTCFAKMMFLREENNCSIETITDPYHAAADHYGRAEMRRETLYDGLETAVAKQTLSVAAVTVSRTARNIR